MTMLPSLTNIGSVRDDTGLKNAYGSPVGIPIARRDRYHDTRGLFAAVISSCSLSGPVGLLPRIRQWEPFKGEVRSDHGVAMPVDVCVTRSTASAISCIIVVLSAALSSI